VGRGDLSRAILIAAAVAAAAATTAAAAVSVHWKTLADGKTLPSGAQAPIGYVAVTRKQEARFLNRLGHADQSKVAHVDLLHTGLVAVFLDGMPCGQDPAVSRVVRSAATVTVTVRWTRPPIGMATCIVTSTPYVVVGVPRASLGRPATTRVKVVAIARA
jgi:hypothetical protein